MISFSRPKCALRLWERKSKSTENIICWIFVLGNSSKPSWSPNFKTKIEGPGLENYAITITKSLPVAIYKNISDESNCFTTHLGCIYKRQAVGRLWGGVQTLKLEKQQDHSLTGLFLFCCRKSRYPWLWLDKLCSKRPTSLWYCSENNWLQV